LTPSSALSLPALFHAGSALGVNPSKLSSSCAAVRCFQRLSPLGVLTAFRVLLRARVRHSIQLFKLKTERVALLGLFPSRVFSLSALAWPSPRLPSCGCIFERERSKMAHFRVSHAESMACLSRDCLPSWGFWPFGRHVRASIVGFWSHLRRRLGFVTVPSTALLQIHNLALP